MNKKKKGDESDGGSSSQEGTSTCYGVPFERFNSEVETWTSFIDRLKNYFEMLGIKSSQGKKKSLILIHTMGH